jgi:glycosyltransferase involved in cell wall biosynthesis
MKLISHINGDSDLIEAWLKYYLRMGVDSFHLVLHGPSEENERLLAMKEHYPIVIEDTYGGPFLSEHKKDRLDAVLARCVDQWVVLVDSDEFVEFPYADIAETIGMLGLVNANLMAAPMLQRMKIDGSFESPRVIDDPFELFPRCSVDLYRRMGLRADIFKFPLFYCEKGTQVKEEGNHHPPIGGIPRPSKILGVTHHFKFRGTVSERLDRRINSAYAYRHESVQMRDYLESHSNSLPLDGSFIYSRKELYTRGLLRRLPDHDSLTGGADASKVENCGAEKSSVEKTKTVDVQSLPAELSTGKKIMFVLSKTAEFADVEKHLFLLLRGLIGSVQDPVVICFDGGSLSRYLDDELKTRITIKYVSEPRSFAAWFRLIRENRPEIIVFYCDWFREFPWRAPVVSSLAGVSRCLSIQHLMPSAPETAVRSSSLKSRLRRMVAHRARHKLKLGLAGYATDRTICVSNAVRDSLAQAHRFLASKAITIHDGVSTLDATSLDCTKVALRARHEMSLDEFLLICTPQLSQASGADILIRAVSRVIRQGIPCKCIILADAPLQEELKPEANSLGLFDHVFFEKTQKDMRPYFHAGSAFVLTSSIEGLPLSLLEAMGCGLACIVTDVGGNSEAVTDRKAGLVITPGSLDELESAIIYLATHPRECAEMGAASREIVCRGFDICDKNEQFKAAILC